MPLRTISSAEARSNLATSAVARWPARAGHATRIEPIARPAFAPSFHIEPGATIFTIGSCFARHVEAALEEHGFHIPTRRFFKSGAIGEFADNGMLDNYGVPAIYNELAWALGKEHYDADHHLVEIQPGRFVDAHLPARMPTAPFDVVMARRERIFEATREVLRADVVIITLGMAEVWRDEVSGYYLNTRPRSAMLVAHPERFTLCVLHYDEILHYLDGIMRLLSERGPPGLRTLLTVSPVPMAATYTGDDVAIANQYSKSVLRAAAQAITNSYKMVDYFPSYESVILSDRGEAWEDDLVHVRPALIQSNVNAMIAAYAGILAETAEGEKSESFANDEVLNDLRRGVRYLQERNFPKALGIASLLRDTPMHAQGLRIEAAVRLKQRRPAEAESLLRDALAIRRNDPVIYSLLGQALLAQGQREQAIENFEIAVTHAPGNAILARLLDRARSGQ